MRWKTFGLARTICGSAALAAVLTVTACGDLFDVTNPGQILDTDLEDQGMIPTLVTGMSGDFSVAVGNLAYAGAVLSDEMAGSSNFVWVRLYARGKVAPEFDLVRWGDVQRARWVAETGIERIQQLLGPQIEGNQHATRAYLFAGLSNRMLGENFCQVAFDGGPAVPRDSAFQRSVTHFTEAIRHAQIAGAQNLLFAAYGGRAQAHVGLGDWTAAVADAQRVPTDFVHDAIFSANTARENNDVWAAGGWLDADISAVGTRIAALPEQDPRARWSDCRGGGCVRVVGGDGVTPLFRQEKYTDRGSNIPVVKGTEMRLIEAEALLRGGGGDVAGAMAKINEVRAHWNLERLIAASSEEAWAHLDRERLITLWLEGRRLHDLDRWDHPFLNGGTVYHTDDVAPRRASCWGFGTNECQTNPNIDC